ncbi:MAG: SGNH/GDSL hydrolase family protein [Lachnospiraceae bacterium]|nr:SGNH/GDSL hydrolase family protein [Lachnospiraceae bacterium]
MKLSFEQIQSITCGAAWLEDLGGQIRFHRFTAEQEALYLQYNDGFFEKCFATTGVVLRFRTDSSYLRIRSTVLKATSRAYFSVDILRDGEVFGHVDNFSGCDVSGDYTIKGFPYGSFQKEFSLGKGLKTIEIHLPWSSELRLDALELEIGSVVDPVKRPKTLMTFGDSITQGYDALRPMNCYTVRLAEALQADEINKAIGGERFIPELAACPDPDAPDYISVAYGTNDWGVGSWNQFSKNCPAFFRNLRKSYPDAKILALTPVWRKDMNEVRKCCEFKKIGEVIRESVRGIPNVTVIDCFDMIPKEERFFADFRLHPNDEGFGHYTENLLKALRETGFLTDPEQKEETV